MSSILAAWVHLAESMCSLAFELVSKQSCLAIMLLSLFGSPSYQSSFMEHDTLVIASGQHPGKANASTHSAISS